MRICHGEMHIGSGSTETERCVRRFRGRALVAETELQDLVFAILGFLPWSKVHIPPYWNGKGCLCHYIFERYNLFSDFTRCGSHKIHLSVKRVFGILTVQELL